MCIQGSPASRSMRSRRRSPPRLWPTNSPKWPADPTAHTINRPTARPASPQVSPPPQPGPNPFAESQAVTDRADPRRPEIEDPLPGCGRGDIHRCAAADDDLLVTQSTTASEPPVDQQTRAPGPASAEEQPPISTRSTQPP